MHPLTRKHTRCINHQGCRELGRAVTERLCQGPLSCREIKCRRRDSPWCRCSSTAYAHILSATTCARPAVVCLAVCSFYGSVIAVNAVTTMLHGRAVFMTQHCMWPNQHSVSCWHHGCAARTAAAVAAIVWLPVAKFIKGAPSREFEPQT